MGPIEIEAWGAWSPWPMEMYDGDPVVFLPPTTAYFSIRPKKVTSWRTCPECGSRATKLMHLSSADPEKCFHCQVCNKSYEAPRRIKS